MNVIPVASGLGNLTLDWELLDASASGRVFIAVVSNDDGVAQEGNPTVIMLMWAKSSAELRGEILAGQLQLCLNPDLEISSQQEIKTIC